MALERATIYFSDGWLVVKPDGWGGPGFKVKRRALYWRWSSWSGENRGDLHYFSDHGRALTLRDAMFKAMVSLPEGAAAELLDYRTPPPGHKRSR